MSNGLEARSTTTPTLTLYFIVNRCSEQRP